MSDNCGFCDAEIVEGAFIKQDNLRYGEKTIKIVNFLNKTDLTDLCVSCGKSLVDDTLNPLKLELENCNNYLMNNIVDFPMMTIGQFPVGVKYKIHEMVTANVSVGTGIFNELSQGFSDIFGMTNTASGMALKVNSGEATARTILANKALSSGSNCIIGVDIDYGTTGNNAATVNMQGTAVYVENINEILSPKIFSNASKITEKYCRGLELGRLLRADFG